MKNNIGDNNEIVDSIGSIVKMVLLKYEVHERDKKEDVIFSFISKSYSLLNAIKILLKEGQYGESVVLYRVLIERYLYLHYLESENMFERFDDWSFVKSYNTRNKARSFPQFNKSIPKEFLQNGTGEVARYKSLEGCDIGWLEPKLEKYARKIDLGFLYSLGYDIGSSYVHPRALEGWEDAKRIVKGEDLEEWRKSSLLNNALAISSGIISVGISASSFDWGAQLLKINNVICMYLNKEITKEEVENHKMIILSELMVLSEKVSLN